MIAIEFIKVGTQLDIFFEETSEINKCTTCEVISMYKILEDDDLGFFLNCTVKCCDNTEIETVVNLYENDFENNESEDCWKFTDYQISKLIKENISTIDQIDELSNNISNSNMNKLVSGICGFLIGLGIAINFMFVNK